MKITWVNGRYKRGNHEPAVENDGTMGEQGRVFKRTIKKLATTASLSFALYWRHANSVH